MATLNQMDRTAENGSDKELPGQEEHPEETPERTHVDALLDISEEDLLKELEPHKYHCYSGWEEAVCGWARVAPLSCILLPQTRDWKPKYKDPDSLPADPAAARNFESSPSNVEPRCDSLKKSNPPSQQTGCCSHTPAAAPQSDAPQWRVLGAPQKNTLHLLIGEKIEEEAGLGKTPLQPPHVSSKYHALEIRPGKPQKERRGPSNTVVPIRNFTFLPPIKSPHLNPQKAGGQLGRGKKASEAVETSEENCCTFDKKSNSRGSRVNSHPELLTYTTALTSRHQTCQQNHYLLSAGSVSIPKRYQVPVSSKADTGRHTGYSARNRFTQAAAAQAHMHPSCLFS